MNPTFKLIGLVIGVVVIAIGVRFLLERTPGLPDVPGDTQNSPPFQVLNPGEVTPPPGVTPSVTPPTSTPAPKLLSITPNTGPSGTTVTIIGNNFTKTNNKIYLNTVGSDGNVIGSSITTTNSSNEETKIVFTVTGGACSTCPSPTSSTAYGIQIENTNGRSNVLGFYFLVIPPTPPPPPPLPPPPPGPPTTDTTPPVITLNGASSIILAYGDSYTDAGATASDAIDGSLPIIVSGSVDTFTAGAYAITYTATDSAGNKSSKTRTITVSAQILDVTPPWITMSLKGGDTTITVIYSGAEQGTPQTPPLTYTLFASYVKSSLDDMAITGTTNSFDNPPSGPFPVSLNTSTPGTIILSGAPNEITAHLRMRVCDSASPKNCSATETLSVTPSQETISVTLGTPETVFDWTTDSCGTDGLDLPDVNARAIKTADGKLHIFAGDAPVYYGMTGTNFNNLVHSCAPRLTSTQNSFAYTFNNWEWIWSVYRIGNTVHALVHNELHDPIAPNCKPGDNSPANACNYTNITYAVSTDHAKTFTQSVGSGLDHVVATLPKPWETYLGTASNIKAALTTPTNIVQHTDGYYYSIFFTDKSAAGGNGLCLMRTNNLASPSSWRAWDGSGFSLTMGPAYTTGGSPAPTGVSACTPLNTTLGATVSGAGSLSWSTYFNKYILVGFGRSTPGGVLTCGHYFTLSDDLINWSTPYLLKAVAPIGGNCPNQTPDPKGSAYPSLIDHNQLNDPNDPNFEKIGQTPYLYYVDSHPSIDPFDRDLVRVPVTFTQ